PTITIFSSTHPPTTQPSTLSLHDALPILTRIRDPRHPGILIRVTELKRDGPLFAARQVNGKPRYQKLAPEVTWVSLGNTEKESQDRKSTRLNSSHVSISYAVFCLKKKILK